MSHLLGKLNEKAKLKKRDAILALAPIKKFDDGRTKQAFKAETDINQIMKRAQVTGTFSHINKYEARYGDFANFDFLGNAILNAQAETIFDALPIEIRNEFQNSPAQFFEHVNREENTAENSYNLPGLAEPGRQNLDTRGNIGADAEKALLEREKPITDQLVDAMTKKPPEDGSGIATTPAKPPLA